MCTSNFNPKPTTKYLETKTYHQIIERSLKLRQTERNLSN